MQKALVAAIVVQVWQQVDAFSRIGYSIDFVRNYTAAAVNMSASTHWSDPSRDEMHARARAACALHDSSIVRRNTDKASVQDSGAWCLPEGGNTSTLMELANGQSYVLPKVHVSADYVNVRFLDRLLRGCDDPAGDEKCTSRPQYSIIDIGAGVGQYGHSLLAKNPAHRYRGLDGAGNVERVTSGFVTWANLGSPTLSVPKADWVMSLAVGEHVPFPTEPAFVRNLHAHNCRGVVLMWGYLGCWGRGHVNNHGSTYLLKLFGELGYVNDRKAAQTLMGRHNPKLMAYERARWRENATSIGAGGPYWWFAKGFYVFRRSSPDTEPGCERVA